MLQASVTYYDTRIEYAVSSLLALVIIRASVCPVEICKVSEGSLKRTFQRFYVALPFEGEVIHYYSIIMMRLRKRLTVRYTNLDPKIPNLRDFPIEPSRWRQRIVQYEIRLSNRDHRSGLENSSISFHFHMLHMWLVVQFQTICSIPVRSETMMAVTAFTAFTMPQTSGGT